MQVHTGPGAWEGKCVVLGKHQGVGGLRLAVAEEVRVRESHMSPNLGSNCGFPGYFQIRCYKEVVEKPWSLRGGGLGCHLGEVHLCTRPLIK